MKKAILITGCSTGIGYTAAHELHKRGYHVIASCRASSDVKRLQNEGLTCIQLDLANPKSIRLGAQKALALCEGRLYGLFNNGAYGQPGALEDLPTDGLREQFEANFFGWHELVRLVLPAMRQHNEGRIIQNSSVLGFAAMRYRGAYNASKFAIEGWTDTLRLELHPSNIRIALIEPGPIETQFRTNAKVAFLKWINIEKSVHKLEYQQQLQRLSDTTSNNQFVLPPEACLAPLIHALESATPKLRYRVTTPTKIFALLKRTLPGKWLDPILRKAA
ncbi:short-chain dehydrogenase [Vibrio sp. 10N.286.49.C2]|uniref:SDR family oxidoreductase n=1 Tax=unclassified Vibrio TaxID=2614977 RepID=UPI000C857D3A|nr:MULTISPECIES: SDR family oxidoreductase [unclassified Vibrio]PMH29830.1 short-chain dehydrogenase [Vibrio sp. 10N.286.49.C2]PMH49827.1 short-chain dehydrogenase [Vibrio sp. 10N.286.49.B1]PMH83643.1 short-chain dehydrogenase [Vibrio sp. 10N.286.48.B7]